MGYSPWGCIESDTTEHINLLLSLIAVETWQDILPL